jgi:hypothetical protein
MMRSDADCLADRWIVRQSNAKHQMPFDGDAPNTEQCRWKQQDSQNVRHQKRIGSSQRTCDFHSFETPRLSNILTITLSRTAIPVPLGITASKNVVLDECAP